MPRGHDGRAAAFAVTLTIAGLTLLLLAAPLASQTPETYDTAMVDASGRSHIRTTDRRQIHPPKDPDQVGFDKAAISSDRLAVGWLALFPNCCTSYPIPLKLVVYVSGRVHTFVGTGLPVWRWGSDCTEPPGGVLSGIGPRRHGRTLRAARHRHRAPRGTIRASRLGAAAALGATGRGPIARGLRPDAG